MKAPGPETAVKKMSAAIYSWNRFLMTRIYNKLDKG